MRRAVRITGAALALASLLAAPAGGVSAPSRVVWGPEDQRLPSVSDAYLIWTQNSVAHPASDHAYAKRRGTSRRFRLNEKGTRGSAGGVDPRRSRAIYQQMGATGSDLYWFNFDTRHRKKILRPINTARRERDPRVSGAFILFARDAGNRSRLLLYNRGGASLREIARRDTTRYFLAPGAVGDRYATWSVCGPFSCDAYVYDAVMGTKTRIPAPVRKAQYAPVVDEENGTVYFARSGHACGASVGIWRRPVDLSARAVRLVAFPAGIDVGWTMSLEEDVDHSRIHLWFSRYRCAPAQGDIYKLRNVDSLP